MSSRSNYKENRDDTFKLISKCFDSEVRFDNKETLLLAGDALELLRRIPDQSISLVLTDPPYHTTKKKNITNDTSFESDDHFIEWMSALADEWHRVLKPTGSIYIFCSSPMAARIEVAMLKRYNVLSHIVWTKPNDPGYDGWKQKAKKESLRQWYDYTERIIFAEPAYEGNLNKSWFGNFLKEVRIQSGLAGHQLAEMIGAYGKVNHGGSVHNWEAGRNIPSREQYRKICEAILSVGKVKSMPYYEDAIRPFEVNSSIEFTDVWNFYSVKPYKGKHPAEKPLDMLMHAVNCSSYENDIVLDCFAGSGSTAIAALKTGRKSVSMEIDNDWVETIKERLEKFTNDLQTSTKLKDVMRVTKKRSDMQVPSLFDK